MMLLALLWKADSLEYYQTLTLQSGNR